jgi:hypothetical protein
MTMFIHISITFIRELFIKHVMWPWKEGCNKKQGLHGNAFPAELVGKYMLNNET